MNTTKDIVDEVKEDIHNERIITLIRNYGKHILVAIITFILAFSIYVYINNQNINKQKKYAEEYQSIFLTSSPSLKEEKSIEKYIKKTNGTIFEYLASFQYAKLLADDKQQNKALDMLLNLSEKNLFPEMSNLALVQASEIIIQTKTTSHRNKVIMQLSSKIDKNDKKIPHFYIMQIMLIQLLIDDGNLKSAKEAFKKMDNYDMLPPNIRLLQDMLSNIIFTKKHD